jgi:hypothetical protein
MVFLHYFTRIISKGRQVRLIALTFSRSSFMVGRPQIRQSNARYGCGALGGDMSLPVSM